MTDRGFRGSKVTVGGTRWWVGAAALGAALGIGLAAGSPGHGDRVPEVWTVLVQTGDELASDPHSTRLAVQSLTARKAYLLAFHQAQDVSDLEHVLFVADRLDATGDLETAAHVRRAADALRQELGP